MIVVGLTGGIGSGKSTVSSALVARGAVLIDADAITRELQQPGTPVFDEIVEHFGAGVVTADGDLDRAALARIVFPDPQRLNELGQIVHPAVGREISARLRELAHSDSVVVVDVPLLIEKPRYPLGAIVVVDAPVETAVQRLVRYRNMDEADVRARLARQATREERLAKADRVVDNSADLPSLLAQVDELWDWMQRLPHADPATYA